MTSPEANAAPRCQPATFSGRLRLSDYAFKGPGSSTDVSISAGRKRKTRSSVRVKPGAEEEGDGSDVKEEETQERKIEKKKKKKKQSSSYAPPSTYAHLPLLPDAIGPDLIVLFVGLNPGLETARTGHAFAHPSNRFWKLMYWSGVTPRLCEAREDGHLPALFSLGLTNIVGRPSRNAAELSKSEMDEGVAALEDKARRWRPEAMCIVGKSIWESIWRVRHGGRGPTRDQFRYGWQDESENMGVVAAAGARDDDGDRDDGWPGARVFVATTTSGLAASMSIEEKKEVWNHLGSWVKKRRAERGEQYTPS
ncbi:thymine-DNA glycosylase [Geosmithia morbida]|uniref:Thymine-DNA glycosylase n=1 Tax=Geosmithia morbida TaxID=1094350 RepID=A0A9P5D611_9HYPO|nr:thymine-DNA glycosylase [Geosmithia morbida]KAF4125131.1 thymine-DNA glycosylase [Geosmithia morbida]